MKDPYAPVPTPSPLPDSGNARSEETVFEKVVGVIILIVFFSLVTYALNMIGACNTQEFADGIIQSVR